MSAVLNASSSVSEELRGRVLRAVEELGYVPHAIARSLKLGRSGVIGLVIPDLTNPHFSSLAHAVEEFCSQRGLLLTLSLTSDDQVLERRQLTLLQRQRADGLLLVPGADTAATAETLTSVSGAARPGPIVLIDRDVAGVTCDVVLLDNRDAIARLTHVLVARGHRRIGFLSGPLRMGIARERLDGFRVSMWRAGLSVNQRLVIETEYQPGPAADATRALLDGDARPTALVSTSNHITVGAVGALTSRGLVVPDDISLVGLDDFAWSEAFHPRLTVASQPVAEMGRTAASCLLERIAGTRGAHPRRLVFRAELIERHSVAAPII